MIEPMRKQIKEPVHGYGFIFALIGILILVLLGGGTHILAQGFALLLAGWFLLKFPPRGSLGRGFNVGALIFLMGGALWMLPGGLGFLPDWRIAGTEALGMDFSATSSVHPLRSIEAFLMLAAGLAWLYALNGLSLNMTGRKRIFFAITTLGLFFALVTIMAMRFGWHYPGSALGEPFTFFAAPGQMEGMLLLLGIFSFCFGMESLTHRSPHHLIGIPASAACFIALLLGQYFTELLFFFIAMGLYCLLQIWSAEVKIWKKCVIGLTSYVILILALTANGGLTDLAHKAELPVKAWQMFIDMPLTGIGLGNYSSFAPHYFEVWQANTAMAYPNDFMWVACAMGIVGFVGFTGMLLGIFRELNLSKIGRLGSLRLGAFLAVLIYLLIGFSGEPRHALALVYFTLMVLVLALPLGRRKGKSLPPRLWKGCGSLFFLVGSLWMFGGMTGLSVHSELILENNKQDFGRTLAEEDVPEAINALNRLVKIDPLNWYWYHERAKLLLKIRERDEAENDFKRALLVEPNLVSPAYEEGKAWFGYLGSKAELAWAEALRRAGPEASGLFERMVQRGKGNAFQAPVLLSLSRLDREYAVGYLEQVGKAGFLEELGRYLESDPALAQFDRRQRTRIMLCWVWSGEFRESGRYMEQYASSLNMAWYLQSYIFQNEARFDEALELLHAGLTEPRLPEAETDPTKIALLERELAGMPRNYGVGLQLLSVRIEQKDFFGGLRLVNELLEYNDAPMELFYWQAELYSQLGNSVESWLSLENYARKQLNLQRE